MLSRDGGGNPIKFSPSSISGSGMDPAARRAASIMKMVSCSTRMLVSWSAASAREKLSRVIPSS
jgi:hypothetical protein